MPAIKILQTVPEEAKVESADRRGEPSLRGHLKADGEQQGGSQSYVPPEAKEDKAPNLALDLMRSAQANPAFPPNRKAAIQSR